MGIFNKFEERLPCEKDKKNNSMNNSNNSSTGRNPSCQASQNLSAAAGNLNAAASNLKKSDTGVTMPQMSSNMGSSNSTTSGRGTSNTNDNNNSSKQGNARVIGGNQARNDSPNSDSSSSESDYAMSRQSLESSETDRSIHDTMKVATPSEDSYGQKTNGYGDDYSTNPYLSPGNGRSSPDVSRSARGGVTNGYGTNDNIPSAGGQKLGNNVSRLPKSKRRPSASDFVNQAQRHYERTGGRPNASANNLRKQNSGTHQYGSHEDRPGGYGSNNSQSHSGRQQSSNDNNNTSNNNSRPGYERSSSYYSRKNSNDNDNNNSSVHNSHNTGRGGVFNGRSNNNTTRDESPDYEPPRANFRNDDYGGGRSGNGGGRNHHSGGHGRDSLDSNSRDSFDSPRSARQRGEEDGVRDAMRDMKIVDEGGRRGGNFNESRGGGGGYGGNALYDGGYGNHRNHDRRGNNDSWGSSSRDSGAYSPPTAKPSKFNTERKMDMAYEAGYKDAMEKIKKNMMSQFNS